MNPSLQRVQESLYFFRYHALTLFLILLPVLLPAMALKHYRIWSILGGDMAKVSDDGLLLVLELLVGLFATAVTILYALPIVRGQTAAASQVRQAAVLAMPRLLLVQVLVGVAIFGGLLLLVVPGLWLAGCLLPAYVLAVGQNLGVRESIRQSFAQFRPQAWQIILSVMLVTCLLVLVLLVVSAMLKGLSGLAVPVKIFLGTGLDSLALLATQLLPILLVRYYDLLMPAQNAGQA